MSNTHNKTNNNSESSPLTTRAENAQEKRNFDRSEQGFLANFHTLLRLNSRTFEQLADTGQTYTSVLRFGHGNYNGQHHFIDAYPINTAKTGVRFYGTAKTNCAHLKKAVETLNKTKEFPYLLKFTKSFTFWSDKCDATADWSKEAWR